MTPDERLKLVLGDLMIAKTFYEARIAELVKENAELMARLAARESAKAPAATEDDCA